MSLNQDKTVIRTPAEWKKEAILELDQAMQHLMACRKLLSEHRLLKLEWEGFFQSSGRQMLKLLKEFQKKEVVKK